jgi:two-component system, chemotaxis family, sensor kinase CheA
MIEDEEFAELFLQESQDNLELLQASLLDLERRPDDPGRLQDAFRAAHSMKGMAGAMGHVSLAGLLHALEDLLGDLREGDARATPGMVTEMLAAVDIAAGSVQEIATTGREVGDVADMVRSLQALREGTAEGHGAVAEIVPDDEVVDAVLDAGLQMLLVDIRPDHASLMPAARAFSALMQAQRLGDVVCCDPPSSELEAGELRSGRLRLWLATEAEASAITSDLLACSEIEHVEVRPWASRGSEDQMLGGTRESDPGDGNGDPSAVRSAQEASDRVLGRGRTVRVEARRLDALMHSVGELLVHRSRVEGIARLRRDPDLWDAVEELTRAAQDMQMMVMDVRMVAIDVVFRRIPRLVRDLEQTLGRSVDLRISGGDTELDRSVVDLLGDPLVHLVRNAVDHGIEPVAVRRAAGKPEHGTLSVSAVAAGGVVVVRVRDDGGGIDPERVRRRAVERGIVTREEAAHLSDEQAVQLCFMPGFSTQTQVSELSGRGVGLDAVRTSVRALGGDVGVDSSPDGTVMTIRLPLTLAIVPVLLVRVGSEQYAIPTTRVRATIEGSDTTVHSVAGRPVVLHEGSALPIVSLAELLGASPTPVERSHVVLVEGSVGTFAISIDEVIAQTEVVTRPVPKAVAASPYLSASAMLGDGEIAFVIDTEAVSEVPERSQRHATYVS